MPTTGKLQKLLRMAGVERAWYPIQNLRQGTPLPAFLNFGVWPGQKRPGPEIFIRFSTHPWHDTNKCTFCFKDFQFIFSPLHQQFISFKERWGTGTNPRKSSSALTSHFLVYDQTLRVRLFTTDHGSFLRHCKVLVYT